VHNLKSAIMASAKGPATQTETGTFVRTYCFKPDFIGFSGHFPGYPILPAVVQVFTILSMAEEVKGRSLELISIVKAKFHIEIHPGQDVRIEYQEGTIQGKPSIKSTVSDGVASSLVAIVSEKE
jgi:3-hydroxyacyl-[acyl-carrier-protein] dehydratase